MGIQKILDIPAQQSYRGTEMDRERETVIPEWAEDSGRDMVALAEATRRFIATHPKVALLGSSMIENGKASNAEALARVIIYLAATLVLDLTNAVPYSAEFLREQWVATYDFISEGSTR